MKKVKNKIEKYNEYNKTADTCSGSYYNFKTGFEYCEKCGECKYYLKYSDHFKKVGHVYELNTRMFAYISDFRKCKK
jgi:hypothetical protein